MTRWSELPFRKIALASAILSGTSSFSASAGFVAMFEQEPNSSLLTAQPIPQFASIPLGVGEVQGTLISGDVDFYKIQFTTAVQFTATVGDLSGALQAGGDAYLAVFDRQGSQLYFNDDLIPSTGVLAGLLSQQLSAGTYYFAVTGEGDSQFEGDHSQELTYLLSITYYSIPLPVATGLGIISAGLIRTRRRS